MKKIFILLISFSLLNSCGTSKGISTNNTVGEAQTSTSKTEGVIEDNSAPTEKKTEVVERPIYKASRTILTNIKHTQLKVDFNWEKSQMNGVATLTCSPHFYATDSLILDAQTMEIIAVKLDNKPLNYKYTDAKKLRIGLDKKYSKDEEYKVVIKYISKPEDKVIEGSSAITSNKGLFFINPLDKKGGEMPQIWTQGETQANSVWFPTIDSQVGS